MKKLNLLTAAAFVFLMSAPAFAQFDMNDITFTIEANVPAANLARFTVSKVDVSGGEEDFQPHDSTALDFGQLELNADGIFVPTPASYWAIDVGSNGAGMPNLVFEYDDIDNPNLAGNGLGARATIALVNVFVDPDLITELDKMALYDVNGESIQGSEYSPNGGWLRLAIGVATDADTDNALPFTVGDAAGDYSGSLRITADFD